MSQIHTRRNSDHPYIDTIWTTRNMGDGIYSATPDGSWDLIVLIESDGSKQMMLTGQATKPMKIPYRRGTASVVISFTPGVYLPAYPASKLVDSFEILPNVDDEHFELLGRIFSFPTYDNAEQLIARLVDAKILAVDPIVNSVLSGTPKATSPRSAQRHFLTRTGIRKKDFAQIERAQEAVRRLQQGGKTSDVAADVGFSDQPHLVKSIKKIMGVTPSQIDDIHKL